MWHPETVFLEDKDVVEMAAYVEDIRGSKKKPSSPTKTAKVFSSPIVPEHPSIVPEHVLEKCEQSYFAAQEGGKAKKKIYCDTGLMAMLCRHDRLLWLVNMTMPGEKQYYAFALLKKLMGSLPMDWTVGLMYNIACQLERSMRKVGIVT
ncbi:MAG TPA: hypothetical protein VGO47_06195 [Chlamydiales bacterium]|nr:hypothetical protein [Chlamydiales bacterium]